MHAAADVVAVVVSKRSGHVWNGVFWYTLTGSITGPYSVTDLKMVPSFFSRSDVSVCVF